MEFLACCRMRFHHDDRYCPSIVDKTMLSQETVKRINAKFCGKVAFKIYIPRCFFTIFGFITP